MTRLPILLCLLSALAAGQMGKRQTSLYDPETFAAAAPAVGMLAPDLAVPRLDATPWALSLERGRWIVLIGASAT